MKTKVLAFVHPLIEADNFYRQNRYSHHEV
jgi:hypothetical protein